MRIFLIGFMGCGKSSLGKRLSRKINFDFIDLDILVEEKAQKKIERIIKEDGEQTFREIERQALLSLSEFDNVVIAAGGGAPCFYDNMHTILSMGISVYLKMNPLSLAKRLEDSKHFRPLLKNKSGQELVDHIRTMLIEREKYYLQANCVIKGENAKPDHIIRLVFGESEKFFVNK
ncbi:MAG: shikimate kinase [Bacteroidota bacterium]